GWIVAWDAHRAARFAERLLREDVLVRTVERRMAIADRTFEAGALFVPRANLTEDVRARVEGAARDTGVTALGVDTGLTREGPDLGSGSVRRLVPLALAVATGEGTAAHSAGAFRYLFEHVLEVPFTALPLESLRRADLLRYNVLVLPDGDVVERVLEERTTARRKSFLERGGT